MAGDGGCVAGGPPEGATGVGPVASSVEPRVTTSAAPTTSTTTTTRVTAATNLFTGASPGGRLEGDHQRLECERRRHVELEHLLARLEDPADPTQVELGARAADELIDVGPDLLVDKHPVATGGDGDRVAVHRDEVHQATVDDVEMTPLRPRFLRALEGGQRRGVLAGTAAALDHAVRRVEVGALARVE